MADQILKGIQSLWGGAKSAVGSAVPTDADFADFAAAPSPAVPSHAAAQSQFSAAPTGKPSPFGPFTGIQGRPYTKWYRVWERVTIADFYQELVIVPVLLVVILVNLWGANANKRRAKQWAATHLPLLESEFAAIGYGRRLKAEDVQREGLAKLMAKESDVPTEFWKESAKNEYTSYCTGRQNVAWLDIKLTLYKRYNPVWWFTELFLSFILDSVPPPKERLEATAYCFDGKEKSLVPAQAQGLASPGNRDSSFDSFVWAVVHKDKMKALRDERYDLSLTSTKDHSKLPIWATVMSESAEITEAILTPDLIKAINEAGEDLEALIISDQPIDAPKRLNDTVARKRVTLQMRLSNSAARTAIFAYFLRLPDYLVNSAHFRSEALRKVLLTREDEKRKLKKLDEEEKAEERRLAGDKTKKEERERKLNSMSAEEQKKFLEKERAQEQKRGLKKRSVRG